MRLSGFLAGSGCALGGFRSFGFRFCFLLVLCWGRCCGWRRVGCCRLLWLCRCWRKRIRPEVCLVREERIRWLLALLLSLVGWCRCCLLCLFVRDRIREVGCPCRRRRHRLRRKRLRRRSRRCLVRRALVVAGSDALLPRVLTRGRRFGFGAVIEF